MRAVSRRLAAWLVDWLCILAWAALTAAVGIPLYAVGVLRPAGPLLGNVLAAIVVVVPVMLVAARLESGERSGTPGKRLLRLAVRGGDAPPAFRHALLRNALKLALPWLVGHAAVFALVADGAGAPSLATLLLLAAAYALPLTYLVGLLAPRHRPLYDRLAGTSVVAAGAANPSHWGLGAVRARG